MPAVATTECALCGLDCGETPLRRARDDSEPAFCCLGCMNVYAILVESGVVASGVDLRETELFRRSRELGLLSRNDGRRKDPVPAQVQPAAEEQERLYHLSGMWCTACAWLIERTLRQMTGVVEAEVSFTADLLKIRYHPQYLPPAHIEKRVASLGYKLAEYAPENAKSEAERQNLLLRLGVAAFFWMNTMLLNLAVYLGQFDSASAVVRRSLPFIVMALALPVVFWSAQPIFRIAWAGLRQRSARMETLLALGIASAFLYSGVQVLRGGSQIYFDIACAVVTLVLLGKNIEQGAREKTLRALASLHRMLPKKARILTSAGEERFVAVDALTPGDLFVVKAGECIPADGVVIEGDSHVDESILSGESAPVHKAVGSTVLGGSVNSGGVLRVSSSASAEDSALCRIVRTVERTLSTRSDVERTVDRVSRAFVPIVILIALGSFALNLALGLSFGVAVMRAVTVLVIACPCALGLATPLALSAAVALAARSGILVRDSRVLDTASRVDMVVLDKTGTLTEGEFELLEANGEGVELAASLEKYSEHPLGRALVRHAEKCGLALFQVSEIEVLRGRGITGRAGGKAVFAGSARLAAHMDPAWKPEEEPDEQNRTPVFYGWDGSVRGRLLFGDRIRPEAPALVRELRTLGMRVCIVSGDSDQATAAVARAVNADEYRAETLPEEKMRFVEELQRSGRTVAAIGDGVNDAPALAKADLGIALSSGTDIAMQSAAMVIVHSDLRRVLRAFDIIRRARKIVVQNLFWAFCYNTLGISLAVAGLLNPIISASAMVVSSAFVTTNSMRVNRERTADRPS